MRIIRGRPIFLLSVSCLRLHAFCGHLKCIPLGFDLGLYPCLLGLSRQPCLSLAYISILCLNIIVVLHGLLLLQLVSIAFIRGIGLLISTRVVCIAITII